MYDPKSKNILKRILKGSNETLDEDFRLRLDANFHRIHALLLRLYPDRSDLQECVESLVKLLILAHKDRKPAFRKLDLIREDRPDWYLSEQLVGMMLYVDRFSEDLKGLKRRQNYFEELGVNLIHLMPLLKCPPDQNDGGYAVCDFRTVSPELGKIEDIEELATQFHEQEMYLMLDLVINHTSDQHEWAQSALAGEKEYQDYYYFYDDRSVPDQFDACMPEVFPELAPGNFTFQPAIDKWVMTVFHEYQWDLNYRNPNVFLEMLDNLLFLANKGVDIVRLDALAFTWKQLGASGQNMEEAHLLIQAFKACTQVVAPAMAFLAEAIVAPNDIVRYFGDPMAGVRECDLAYNATLMTLLWEAIATKKSTLTNIALDHVPTKPGGTTWLNYIRCHDDIGLGYEDHHAAWAGYDPAMHRTFLINFLTGDHPMSFARGAPFMRRNNGDARISGMLASLAGLEKALDAGDERACSLALDRIIMLHAIIMSYGGIPMLYMGDAIGTLNDYDFQETPELRGDNRWMHRPKMDWKKEKLKNKKGTLEEALFSNIKKLIAIRKQSREFEDSNNVRRINCKNEHLFGYLREKGVYRTFCLNNFNDAPESFDPEILQFYGFDLAAPITDRISNQRLNPVHGGIMVEGYQSMWISQC